MEGWRDGPRPVKAHGIEGMKGTFPPGHWRPHLTGDHVGRLDARSMGHGENHARPLV